jgi:hypothetical protein
MLAFCAQLASYLTEGEIEAKPSISSSLLMLWASKQEIERVT